MAPNSCIFAYTASGESYPPYINVKIIDGQLRIAVRGPKERTHYVTEFGPRERFDAGPTGEMTIPVEEVVELYSALRRAVVTLTDND